MEKGAACAGMFEKESSNIKRQKQRKKEKQGDDKFEKVLQCEQKAS